MPRIRRFGAVAKCKDCNYRWETLAKKPQCPKCRSWHVEIDESFESVVPFLIGRILWELEKLDAKVSFIEKKLKKRGGEKSGC